jgi:type VI secretion system protein ImpK
MVTLPGGDLFGSGSADVNPSYDAILQRVAEALNKVPGRVMIYGHTDDQRIRSLQFPDNVQLSRARAQSVLAVLQRTIDNPARLRSTGVGASDPRHRPESTPENRARNRRVEIVHIRGT